jgi:hypothetical protein
MEHSEFHNRSAKRPPFINGNYSRILNRLNRNITELEVRRAFTVFQLMTILEENHHSFLIVEYDPLLYEDAEKRMVEYLAQALKLQARLEDLTVWQMEEVMQSRKGPRTYSYWMASWREGGKTRNVHLGSSRKMDGEAARRKARVMKAAALAIKI